MFGFVFPSIPKPGAAGQPRALSQHATGRRTLAKCRAAHQLIQIAQTPVLYAVFFLIILDTVMCTCAARFPEANGVVACAVLRGRRRRRRPRWDSSFVPLQDSLARPWKTEKGNDV